MKFKVLDDLRVCAGALENLAHEEVEYRLGILALLALSAPN
jgi:hypothetical protein